MPVGEVILVNFLRVVLDKLGSPLFEELWLLLGVGKECQKLQSTLSAILAVLEDAEARQAERTVSDWLRKLKDAAYEAEDVLDEFEIAALKKKIELQDSSGRGKSKVRDFFSGSNPVMLRHRMARKIQKIKERLDSIAEERTRYQFNNRSVPSSRVENPRPQTFSYVNESEIVGRVEDRSRLVNLLLGDGSEDRDVAVIPVVGMGGLGKTTLAQLAYNHEQVRSYFELKIWVCVSNDFDVRRIMKSVIESVSSSGNDLSDMDPMHHRLQNLLNGRRYLLVLDDVWNEDTERWENLRAVLGFGSRGSKILVTTRSERVASIVGTLPPVNLTGLSVNDCWTLFAQRALRGRRVEEVAEISAHGVQMVRRCGGVPLAAKVLGSLMFFKNGEREWASVANSEIWNLPNVENGVLPALRLSYDYLPSPLKPCFAYCSLFPKDYKISKTTLVKLWVAEGFLSSSYKQAEEIGLDYFEDLLSRSFFQDIEKDSTGNITTCKMHDLICDLARSIVGSEFSRDAESIHETTRHASVSFNQNSWPTDLRALKKSKNLRTVLICNATVYTPEVPGDIFSHLKNVRVLDLSRTFIQELPDTIGLLKHLRHLDLSSTKIERLPNTICDLHKLQTLKLTACEIKELPRDMRKMISLRHVEVDWQKLSTKTPIGLGQLVNLQTLPRFVVGKEKGRRIEELGALNNLRDVLEIDQLQNVRNETEAEEAKLREKNNISSLKLTWSSDDPEGGNPGEHHGAVLEGLQPHSNLNRLTIGGYRGRAFPGWMMSTTLDYNFPNLLAIELYDCAQCDHLPPLGRLRFLKVLKLERLNRVRFLSRDPYGFPSLEEISLKYMANLEGWCEIRTERGEALALPRVSRLTIEQCPNLLRLPLLSSRFLQYLTIKDSNEGLLSRLDVSQLESLIYLSISGFPWMEQLPLGNHGTLMMLEIAKFVRLRNLPFDRLKRLVTLKISDCHEVASLLTGLENLTGLKTLTIKDCPGLTAVPVRCLSNVPSLDVINCGQLRFMEVGMQYLTVLKHLNIWDCKELRTLPHGLQNLPELTFLSISDCESLESLPEWIGSLTRLGVLHMYDCPRVACLPAGLQRLTRLEILLVGRCPQLRNRCARGSGEDWYKIAHIPKIFNNGRFI